MISDCRQRYFLSNQIHTNLHSSENVCLFPIISCSSHRSSCSFLLYSSIKTHFKEEHRIKFNRLFETNIFSSSLRCIRPSLFSHVLFYSFPSHTAKTPILAPTKFANIALIDLIQLVDTLVHSLLLSYMIFIHLSVFSTANSYWHLVGNTIVTDRYVRLTSDSQSKAGGLWNSIPVSYPDWEMHVHFKVYGTGKELFGDGFAIWYARDPRVTGELRVSNIFVQLHSE
jgi:hypothetical protein